MRSHGNSWARRLATAALALTAALAAGRAVRGAAPEPGHRAFDATSIADLDALARLLHARVALLEVDLKSRPDEPAHDPNREGYAVALDAHHLAALSFLLEDATAIRVVGPKGKAIRAHLALRDEERRVAILETTNSVAEIGLVPIEVAPLASRHADEDVFALTNTTPEGGVVHGVLIYVGNEPEYGGHHRLDLTLDHGTPVFDDQARFVGYSRTVAWDRDKRMLITPEMISAARTATGAVERPPPTNARPWWSR